MRPKKRDISPNRVLFVTSVIFLELARTTNFAWIAILKFLKIGLLVSVSFLSGEELLADLPGKPAIEFANPSVLSRIHGSSADLRGRNRQAVLRGSDIRRLQLEAQNE